MPINPAVYAAAALFTDGAITDAVLADVAAMRGLPLHVPAPLPLPPAPKAPTLADLTAAAWRAGEEVLSARAAFVRACRAVAFWNTRTPYAPGATAADRAAGRGNAFRAMNRARAAVRAAERAMSAARVEFDAAQIAHEMKEAA